MSGDGGNLLRITRIHSSGFTALSNHAVRNPSLSLAARGLLWELCSHAPGYEVTIRGLAATSASGKDAIATAKTALVAAGYLRVQQVRDGLGRVTGSEWVVTDDPDANPLPAPEGGKPIPDYPGPENPDLGKPDLGNPPQRSTEVRSTEGRNTEGASPTPAPMGELNLGDTRKKKEPQPLIPMTMTWLAPKSIDEFATEISFPDARLDEEILSFQRYFIATGHRRTDRGWVQALRKWLVNAMKFEQERQSNGKGRGRGKGRNGPPTGMTIKELAAAEHENAQLRIPG